MSSFQISNNSRNYLDQYLLSEINDINVKMTSSKILEALGYADIGSTQSFVISVGNRLETFWNKVISDSKAENLIEGSDRIVVEGEYTTKRGKEKTRQIDGCFKINNKFYYRELKCNLTFDSEKKPASEAKIEQIRQLISKKYGATVDAGYIVPCVDIPDYEMCKKVTDRSLQVNGVRWLIETLETDNLFTCDEFMWYLKNIIGPVFKRKMGL